MHKGTAVSWHFCLDGKNLLVNSHNWKTLLEMDDLQLKLSLLSIKNNTVSCDAVDETAAFLCCKEGKNKQYVLFPKLRLPLKMDGWKINFPFGKP